MIAVYPAQFFGGDGSEINISTGVAVSILEMEGLLIQVANRIKVAGFE